MIIIKPSIILELQKEFDKFIELSNQHKYEPTPGDINDVIYFLLNHGVSNGMMLESDNKDKLKQYLFEYYYNNNGTLSFDKITDVLQSSRYKTSSRILNKRGDDKGSYIKYIFKRNKLKDIAKKIQDENLEILKVFENLVKVINKYKTENNKSKNIETEIENMLIEYTPIFISHGNYF